VLALPHLARFLGLGDANPRHGASVNLAARPTRLGPFLGLLALSTLAAALRRRQKIVRRGTFRISKDSRLGIFLPDYF
jgi:hypothetical protein